MSLIGNLLGVSSAPQGGGSTDNSTETEETSNETKTNPSEASGEGDQTSDTKPSGQTETVTAVQPTPVTSSAIKVDSISDSKPDEGFSYPITGPDDFAQALAEQSRAEFNDSRLVESVKSVADEYASYGTQDELPDADDASPVSPPSGDDPALNAEQGAAV